MSIVIYFVASAAILFGIYGIGGGIAQVILDAIDPNVQPKYWLASFSKGFMSAVAGYAISLVAPGGWVGVGIGAAGNAVLGAFHAIIDALANPGSVDVRIVIRDILLSIVIGFAAGSVSPQASNQLGARLAKEFEDLAALFVSWFFSLGFGGWINVITQAGGNNNNNNNLN